jgi:hypothetical protein
MYVLFFASKNIIFTINIITMEKKKVTRKKAAPKAKAKEVVKLDPKKFYEFVVTKDSKHLTKGVYNISGAMAEILTKKGLGAVK